MSRGLGRYQLDLLTTAVACEDAGWCAGRYELYRFGEMAVRDDANIYRGLRALARRGLLILVDTADYAPRCHCGHAPAQHYAHGRDRGCRGWCRCHGYRQRPTPRPCWRARSTEAGRHLAAAYDLSEVRAAVREWRRQVKAFLRGK